MTPAPKRKTARLAAERDLASLSCSDGWFVTGYYTPEETEFSGDPVHIIVKDQGPQDFPADFLKHVKIEGWAKTRYGWFLGWSNGWIAGNAALNARGRPLHVGSLAVDRGVIPLGTSIRIPDLIAPFGSQLFMADDTGGGIIGKHVDVYCGDGRAAHDLTYRVTGDNRRVCFV